MIRLRLHVLSLNSDISLYSPTVVFPVESKISLSVFLIQKYLRCVYFEFDDRDGSRADNLEVRNERLGREYLL